MTDTTFSVTEFDHLINSILELLKTDRLEDAQALFNTRETELTERIWNNKEPIHVLGSFYLDLSDYLRKSSWREVGAITLDALLSSYHSDYQESLREALALEASQ